MTVTATTYTVKESAVISLRGRATIPAHYCAEICELPDADKETILGGRGILYLTLEAWGTPEMTRAQTTKQLKVAAGRLAEQLLEFSRSR